MNVYKLKELKNNIHNLFTNLKSFKKLRNLKDSNLEKAVFNTVEQTVDDYLGNLKIDLDARLKEINEAIDQEIENKTNKSQGKNILVSVIVPGRLDLTDKEKAKEGLLKIEQQVFENAYNCMKYKVRGLFEDEYGGGVYMTRKELLKAIEERI